MRLGPLFMALTVIHARGRVLRIASAGMPPGRILRCASGLLEEVPGRGVPLGTVAHYPYREIEVELAPGDTLLLQSDGLAEQFAGEDEMFGYRRIDDLLAKSCSLSPQALISGLLAEVDRWTGGASPTDDITLMAIRSR